MAENIEQLRNAEQGKEIYIVGSGKSIDFIPDEFWVKKTVIGVNFVPLRVPSKYLITHHYFVLNSFTYSPLIIVTSEYEMGISEKEMHNKRLSGDYFYYHHLEQRFTEVDLSVFDIPEYLITGGTIITSALHFAYMLGASSIVLAGVDGGAINGEINYAGYPTQTPFSHCKAVNNQLELMVSEIRKHIPVVSLNPFINFNLEGNVYENSLLDS
jgi:hypothetical protein